MQEGRGFLVVKHPTENRQVGRDYGYAELLGGIVDEQFVGARFWRRKENAGG